MTIIEKILLRLVVYMLIMIFAVTAAMSYLTLANKPLSIMFTFILAILFYVLTIIEEQ